MTALQFGIKIMALRFSKIHFQENPTGSWLSGSNTHKPPLDGIKKIPGIADPDWEVGDQVLKDADRETPPRDDSRAALVAPSSGPHPVARVGTPVSEGTCATPDPHL